MIGKLSGVVESLPDGSMVVEVSGVGYVVRVPFSALVRNGERISLFIHTAVREDAIDLYGFPTERELSFFKLLMSVSGIGPKTALGILNVADVQTLTNAIARGDAASLTKVYGLGKKSAERIIVELRDKVGRAYEDALHEMSDIEVLEALETLGYSAAETRKALQALAKSTPPQASAQEKLAAALKHLGSATQKT